MHREVWRGVCQGKEARCSRFLILLCFPLVLLFLPVVKMLETEPDFRDQKPLIVEAVEEAGGRVLFGTKFHPELMAIKVWVE